MVVFVGGIEDVRVFCIKLILNCWGQMPCRGQLGSARGQFAYKCFMATKCDQKNP